MIFHGNNYIGRGVPRVGPTATPKAAANLFGYDLTFQQYWAYCRLIRDRRHRKHDDMAMMLGWAANIAMVESRPEFVDMVHEHVTSRGELPPQGYGA